jgi:hypothetical protein
MGFQPHFTFEAMSATELADEDEVVPHRRDWLFLRSRKRFGGGCMRDLGPVSAGTPTPTLFRFGKGGSGALGVALLLPNC